MTAVAEPAVPEVLLDVGEAAGDPLLRLPHPELAHAGRVDRQHAVFQQEQLAVGGRVPAPPVLFTDAGGAHDLPARQRVHKGRLSRARRAEEDDRPARLQVVGELVEAVPRAGADREDPRPGGELFRRAELVREVLHGVHLCEQDRRDGARLPRERQVPLQPARRNPLPSGCKMKT